MEKHTYIHIWTTALTQFGWPTTRIDEFVCSWINDLNNEYSFFYHELPSYYLTFELLSEQAVREMQACLAGKSKGYAWKLFEPVQNILERHLKTFMYGKPVDPDWQTVKKEIVDFLAENGESLRYP